MKHLLALILSVTSAGAHAATQDPWINPLTLNMNTAKVIENLPRDQFFEVSVSMLESAQERLSEHPIVSQEWYDAEYFGQPAFACPKAKRLYLIRAVYQNGRTGGYHLQRVEDSLWVAHESLGVPTGQHRSALLACLDFQPKQVFITTGGGM